jgi:hypothetical protein
MAVDSRLVVDTSAAVVTGVSSIVPVPFLGDWLVARSRHEIVKRALLRHGRTFKARDLVAFYDDPFSWLGLPWRFVKGLVLAPIKRLLRMLFVVLAVRDVALNVGRTLALGHTLDRMLRTGSFKNDDSVATRRHEAARLRKAFDEAFRGVDERVVRRAMAAVRQQVGRAAGGIVGVVDVAGDAEVAAFLAELDRRVDHALLGRPLG